MPLRTIARCLRGMASILASASGKQVLAERDVEILARPVGALATAIAQLEMLDAEALGRVACGVDQRSRRRAHRWPRRPP